MSQTESAPHTPDHPDTGSGPVTVMSKSRRLRLKKPSFILVGLVLILGLSAVGYRLRTGTDAASCTVSATLVNSCRPWLGAASGKYTGFTAFRARMENHESRIGRQVDVVHDYAGPGFTLNSGSDYAYFVNRPNTYLMLNWKPVTGGTTGHQWKDADGRDATINSQITATAKSIKALDTTNSGSHKIFITLWHEPDNDISPGGSPGCVAAGSATTGNMGTTTDYVNMWHNVRSLFDAAGVKNVVWAWNPMGYAGHNCDVNDLYPGNSYVDWILWDPYIHNGKALSQTGVGLFYSFLNSNTTSSRAYTSKPWGLNEWGSSSDSTSGSTYRTDAYNGYDEMKAALDSATYPNLKMYNVWDSAVSGGLDWRIDYDSASVQDDTEQNHYKAFASDPRFTDSFYAGTPAPADTIPPSVSFSAPAEGATVSGTIAVIATASDNMGVSKVELYRGNGSLVSAKTTAPYNFSFDTTGLTLGNHVLYAKAYDAAGNVTQSANLTINVQMPDTTAPTVSIASPTNGAVVSGQVTVTARAGDNLGVSKVEFYRGGLLRATATVSPYTYVWDSTSATDGQYQFYAVAYDAVGNHAQSGTVSLTVAHDTTPPAVTVSGLSSGSNLKGANKSPTVTVSATDNVGVTSLSVTVDGKVVASGTTDYLSFRLNPKQFKGGTHTLIATAKDAADNTTTKTVAFSS